MRRALWLGMPVMLTGHVLVGSACAAPSPALSSPASSSLPPLPAPESRRFEVSIGDFDLGARVAEITYRMTHGEGGYRIETVAQASGLVALVYSGQLTQTSEGRVGPTGLMPEHYTEKRGRRPERSVRFDRAAAVMIGNGDPPTVPLPAGTQDRLSLAYQLGLIVRAEPRMAREGQRLSLPLASMKMIETVTITCAGDAGLRIRGERLKALKYEIRNPRHADDRIDIWLSPDQSMLPVRIRFAEGEGKVIDQVLSVGRP